MTFLELYKQTKPNGNRPHFSPSLALKELVGKVLDDLSTPWQALFHQPPKRGALHHLSTEINMAFFAMENRSLNHTGMCQNLPCHFLGLNIS